MKTLQKPVTGVAGLRTLAGLARAKSQGKRLGRPTNRNEGTVAATEVT